jgi:beta-glucosidase
VRAGRVSLDSFLASLSLEELESLTRGEGRLNSPFGVSGNTGVFGGVLASLRARGVRPLVTADGPAGLRLNHFSSLIPIGTALACTWNTELVEALHRKIGEEMTHYGVDIHLAPGMNLHRDPLCGRNFEYYSEDPLLSGKIAAAAVRGVQSTGHASCPKHFACNNQEFRRNRNDSRVSERALRELYLRGFEICVREAKPLCLMTSYNKVNGVWSHYNYDLATTVLRKEWGFEGVTMTDWWMQAAQSPEFPALRNNAYRVRAGVDVLMPGDMRHIARRYRADSTLLESFGKPEGITRGELERSAGRVLSLILRLYP